MPRMTLHRALILRVMLSAPFADWYGLELAQLAGFKTGTVYPALAALEQTGLMDSRWEDVDPSTEGRPRRRLYQLCPHRLQDARAYVAQFDAVLQPATAPQRGAVRVMPRGRLA
jgi:PadR family transcriptional regulator, regulatory protein PadR